MHTPLVAIIILNWNGKEDTIKCLESMHAVTYANYDIMIVDNGSTDGSVVCLRERYPEIDIIENTENLGFAGGNNVGITKAMDRSADYVLLLNNDVVVDLEFLQELVDVAESDQEVGFVGPKIYYESYKGKRDVIEFAGARLNIRRGDSHHIGQNEADVGQHDKIREVDYITGACLLVKKEVIRKIGLIDPVYFMYWEDADWQIRGKKMGYKSVYVPASKVWHKISAASGGETKAYFLTRNRFLFMKKNFSRSAYLSFLIYFFMLHFGLESGLHILVHNSPKTFSAFCKGVIDGLKIT